MSLRDRKTPLTDSEACWEVVQFKTREIVSGDFARRLEQERDAAVEALKEIKRAYAYVIPSSEAVMIASAVLAEIGEKG